MMGKCLENSYGRKRRQISYVTRLSRLGRLLVVLVDCSKFCVLLKEMFSEGNILMSFFFFINSTPFSFLFLQTNRWDLSSLTTCFSLSLLFIRNPYYSRILPLVNCVSIWRAEYFRQQESRDINIGRGQIKQILSSSYVEHFLPLYSIENRVGARKDTNFKKKLIER